MPFPRHREPVNLAERTLVQLALERTRGQIEDFLGVWNATPMLPDTDLASSYYDQFVEVEIAFNGQYASLAQANGLESIPPPLARVVRWSNRCECSYGSNYKGNAADKTTI